MKKKEKKEKRKKDWIDYLLTFVIIASICSAVYFAYEPIKDYFVAKNNEQKTEKIAKEIAVPKTNNYPNVKHLKETENQGIIGWIRIPNTNIDEPIVQGSDNEWYLEHAWNNTYDSLGSIFLDAKAASNFTDNLSFVFGHNTYLDNKFSQLAKFKDADFRNKTKQFYFFTDKNEKITYDVIGVGTIEPTNPMYTENKLEVNADNLDDFRDDLKTYTDISDEDLAKIEEDSRLTLLVTCLNYNDSSGREIILAKEISRESY